MTSMLFYAYCKSQRTPLLDGEENFSFSCDRTYNFHVTDLIGLRRLFESLLPAKVAVLSTPISIGYIYIFERKDFMKSLHDNFHFAFVHDSVYSPLWRTATEYCLAVREN
ncbi:hypothetical protein T10_3939 [Trichinella papuae]|uniref:Uncharacterized protein n=1 Tax=Trichinella papuae TaxID=268474 RepID=A0A0V1MVF3_9BILA|nr:hypothetical protein T10_3939 [Trichinella papuae]